jgi:hypothetical protein
MLQPVNPGSSFLNLHLHSLNCDPWSAVKNDFSWWNTKIKSEFWAKLTVWSLRVEVWFMIRWMQSPIHQQSAHTHTHTHTHIYIICMVTSSRSWAATLAFRYILKRSSWEAQVFASLFTMIRWCLSASFVYECRSNSAKSELLENEKQQSCSSHV